MTDKTLDDVYDILTVIKDILIEANVNRADIRPGLEDLPDVKIMKYQKISDKKYKVMWRE